VTASSPIAKAMRRCLLGLFAVLVTASIVTSMQAFVVAWTEAFCLLAGVERANPGYSRGSRWNRSAGPMKKAPCAAIVAS
jgi:hypothetical protein